MWQGWCEVSGGEKGRNAAFQNGHEMICGTEVEKSRKVCFGETACFPKKALKGEALVFEIPNDTGKVENKRAFRSTTPKDTVSLAEDAVVLELRREEAGVVWVG